MRLRPWCRERDLTLSDFARLIRCRPQVVHKWIEGSIPDPKYMRQIYRVTQGQVCPNDLFYALPNLDLDKFDDGLGGEIDDKTTERAE